MRKVNIHSGLILAFAVSAVTGLSFMAVDSARAESNASKMPHIMAAGNLEAWANAMPTTCRGVRFDRVGKSDTPRYIFYNDGIEGTYAGKEASCIPIDASGKPASTRGEIVKTNSDTWKNAKETFCTDVRFRRGSNDTVFWVFSSRAAVFNDLSTCTKTDSGHPMK